MTRHRTHRRAAALLIAMLGLAGAPAASGAGLHPLASSGWSVAPPFSAQWIGSAMHLSAPETALVPVGNRWEMSWNCPNGGSEIAHVSFGGLRTAAPSSLAVQVTGGRVPLWSLPDAQLPQSPAGGQTFTAVLPPGQCHVHLALTQTEARKQHKRGYFIDNPRAVVRDLQAPSVVIRSLTQGWINALPRPLAVEWEVADNFGSAGVAQQQVVAGGRTLWAGNPGVGRHGVSLSLADVGDGRHTVEVRAQGWGTAAGTATGALNIDRTPPTASTQAPTHPGEPRRVNLSWAAGDATSGVAQSHVEVASGGTWTSLGEAAGAGPHTRSVSIPAGIPDGEHSWRVRVQDHAGNVRVQQGTGAIVVDTTPPQLTLVEPPDGWVRSAELRAIVDDNLAKVLGLGDAEVEINTATDGGGGGTWTRTLTTRPDPGQTVLPLDLSQVADGRHLVRVSLRNGGPFGDHLVTRTTTTVQVDRTAPRVAAAEFSVTGDGSLNATWSADDELSGVARTVLQWDDGGTWRTLGGVDARDGAGALAVDAATLGDRVQRARVVIIDGAGNTAAREGAVSRSARGAGDAPAAGAAGDRDEGLGSTAGDPLARLRTAKLSLAAPGATATRAASGRVVLTRTLGTGRPMVISGRLVDRSGRPIAGAQVDARGHRGAVLGRTRTRADGRLRMTVRPEFGGPVRVGVPAGGGLLPARAGQDLRLRVAPRVVLRRHRLPVRSGETVVFSGRVYPAPGRAGLAARKGVVLEWRDPLRGVWRPVVNARLRRDGTFSIPWRFALTRITIPMRARVPAELGWPLVPALSHPTAVMLR